MRTALLALVGVLAAPAAHAVLTFDQLDDDLFVVSHRVKFIGSRGQAMRLVYTKAASLCEAAGYTYLTILEQESEAEQEHENANASVRVRFHLEDGEDRIDCLRKADPKYVEEAREKLARRGYRRAVVPRAPAAAVVEPARVATAEPAGTEAADWCAYLIPIEEGTTHAGIDAENRWIAEHHPGFRKVGQELTACGDRRVDIVRLENDAGEVVEVRFDITSFYGKW